MVRIFAVFFAAIWLLPLSAQDIPDEYPRDWAIDILHYRFNLTLSDSSNEILGRADVTVGFVEDGSEGFVLDLVGPATGAGTGMEVLGVSRNGDPVQYTHTGDRLAVILLSPSSGGEQRTYSISYRGTPADGLIIGTNRWGERTFFGDNWPDRARHWLPTVDHVSDKATVEWVVTAPEDYEVVGTGILLERSDLPDGTELTHWASDVPIPPKVMVMGAARFAIRTTGYVDGIPIQAWVYPRDREAGFLDFAQAEKAVRFFHERVGPFPYEKLANVQSKTRYGGMENAGNIFYSENAVRGDLSNEGLIVHEIAHQWFGDSVTELDWNHIWLSEGFATYFTHLYREVNYGRDQLVEGLRRDRATVSGFFSQHPDQALVALQLTDPNEMLNRNAYQKGSWVLHMLRHEVGDEAFWSGIREYYGRFRDGSALTEDFQAVMEEVSGQDLQGFFHQWVYVPGHPMLEGRWSYDTASETLSISVTQTQETGAVFHFPLDIGLVSADGSRQLLETVQIHEGTQTFTFPLTSAPADVVLDPDTWLLFEGGVSKGEAG